MVSLLISTVANIIFGIAKLKLPKRLVTYAVLFAAA